MTRTTQVSALAASLALASCAALVGIKPLTADEESVDEAPSADAAPEVSTSDAADAGPDAFDSGVREAGCRDTGQRPPRTVTVTGNATEASWASQDEVVSRNDAGATVTPGFEVYSRTLRALAFGLSLPEDATIQSLFVHIRARSVPRGGMKDATVRLVHDDGDLGTNLSKPEGYEDTFEDRAYGGPPSAWSAVLTPTTLNSPGFGIAYAVTRTTLMGTTLEVDAITVDVTYCE